MSILVFVFGVYEVSQVMFYSIQFCTKIQVINLTKRGGVILCLATLAVTYLICHLPYLYSKSIFQNAIMYKLS